MTMVRRNGGWLAASVGEQVLMMHPDHENYVGLNIVGSYIWELLNEPMSLDDIAARVVAEFEVEAAQARSDAEAFLAELEKIDAIARDPVVAA